MSLLEQGANALSTIALFLPLIFFSCLSFWKENYILFLITAAIAMITGFETPNIMCGEYATSWLSVTIGIVLIYVYTPLCLGLAMKLMIWRDREAE